MRHEKFEDKLAILRFPDLAPWQWRLFEPVVRALRERVNVEVHDVALCRRTELRERVASERAWLLANDWRGALRRMAPDSSARLSVSVLDMPLPRRALATLFVKHVIGSLPSGVRFLTYSPLNYRFLREMERFHDERLALLPLTLPDAPRRSVTAVTRPPLIGTFAPLVSDSNLHYFLNVAHYVCQRHPTVNFRLMGAGPLFPHFRSIARELGLDGRISVLHATEPEVIRDLDVFLYVPLRNDHFAPLFFAAASGVPTLASEVPGIEQLIADANDGFVFRVHETKPMGELCLRLLETPSFGRYLAGRLGASLTARFSADSVSDQYLDLFFGGRKPDVPVEAVA